MKITLDIPDTTMGAFFTYVYQGEYAMLLEGNILDSSDLKDGALIKVQLDGGGDNGTD